MKQKVLLLCLLNVVSILCTQQVSDQADSRKNAVRSAAATVGTSAHLNSLQSSQETGAKTQTQTISNGQTTYRVTTPEFSAISQPQNAYYTQPSSPTGGYFITVNPQGIPTGSLSPGPTPVIMQYLPHNAQQGPIQYLQLIPTRPLIVPISPYFQNGYNSPYSSVGGPSQSPQASASPSYSLPHHSYASPSTPHQYSSSYPSSLSNPVGGYSTNYLTYFRPSHGMQLINSPIDLSLNTDEYLPIRNENSYKMRQV